MVRAHALPWIPLAVEKVAPAAFQAIVAAMESPGTAVLVPARIDALPGPLNDAAAALIAAWAAPETPVWTDLGWGSPAAAWLVHALGLSLVTEPCMARVALAVEPSRLPPLGEFRRGEGERSEPSTTVILQVPGFRKLGSGASTVRPAGLPRRFWSDWRSYRRSAAEGVDLFFTCARSLVAPPRGA